MTTPRNWKSLKRHPLSSEYADLAGKAFADFEDNIRRVGFLKEEPVVLCDGLVLDGWQRQRVAVNLGTPPAYVPIPKGITPEDFVSARNDHRRHMSQEQARTMAEARRERVLRARTEGQSQRVIAEKEGVSRAQVVRDLKEVSGGPGGPPETPNGQVTGRDGRRQSATKTKSAPLSPPAEPKDALGNAIPDNLRDTFLDPWYGKTLAAVADLQDQTGAFLGPLRQQLVDYSQPYAVWLLTKKALDFRQAAMDAIDGLLEVLENGRPYAVCRACQGKSPVSKIPCKSCSSSGWYPKWRWAELAKGGAK